MSDQFDQELEELFPEDLTKANLTKVVKKARRRTVIRNAAISVVASVVVLGCTFFLNGQLIHNTNMNLFKSAMLLNQISEPNVYVGGDYWINGLFGGELQFQTYKMIEGVPIPWETQRYSFDAFGHFSILNGDYGSQLFTTQNGVRAYNSQTEQREMLYYHPDIKYDHYLNDFSQLKNVPSGKCVEMAISFDKSYDFAQTATMLPNGIHPVWYWVNTYSEKELKLYQKNNLPMLSYQVAGFQYALNPNQPGAKQTPTDFINSVETGMKIRGSFQDKFQRIYDAMSHGKGKITPSDVKMIGVVVTGTPQDLMGLQGKTYVKAAVLGAIASPY